MEENKLTVEDLLEKFNPVELPAIGLMYLTPEDWSTTKQVISEVVYVGGGDITMDMPTPLKYKARWCKDYKEFIIKKPTGEYEYMNTVCDVDNRGWVLWEKKTRWVLN